MSFKISRLI